MKSFDENWQFSYGDNWVDVTLPHDASISFSADNCGGFRPDGWSSEDGASGYLPYGKCAYRKNFSVKHGEDELVFLVFEGICRKSVININGHEIHGRENGNLGFEIDITPYLKDENELYITVDNTPREKGLSHFARWYTGTGIYRHTFIDVRPKNYVKNIIINADGGEVHIKSEFDGSGEIRVLDGENKVVAEGKFTSDTVIKIPEPILWSPDLPYLYTAEITVKGKKILKNFGIRKIELTREHGVIINGKPFFPQGFNIHHDLGVCGTAAYDSLIYSRLKLLKSIGVNALRLSHNPHTPELLDMCDELGFLVFDECFDKLEDQYFDSFESCWQQELRDFILRDINHPCVYVWSIGNETDQQRFMGKEGAEYIKKIVDFAQSIDPSRPVTVAQYPCRKDGINWAASGWNDSAPSDVCTSANVCSYNYTFFFFEKDMAIFPEKVFIQSEAHVGNPNLCGLEEVKRLNACGQFYWGGVEYLGEAISPEYRGWARGFIDICDNKKSICYQVQAAFMPVPVIHAAVMQRADTVVWNDVSLIHNKIFDHWNWQEGEEVHILVYSNCQKVRLFLNNRPLGECEKAGCCVFAKDVIFAPGTLTAVGYDENGEEIIRHGLTTHAEVKYIRLTPTSMKKPAPNDAVAVDACLFDENGNICAAENSNITFTVENGYLAGCGTGDLSTRIPYSSPTHPAYLGRARAVVRTNSDLPLKIIAICGNIKESVVLY